MHANNETGVESPLNSYSEILNDHDAWWHVDAAQTYGKANQPLADKRIDMISISGHKMFAPKGVGALVVRRRGYTKPPLAPLVLGGGQERGIRPGTLPVPLIAGLGLAAELSSVENTERKKSCLSFREVLLEAFEPLNPTYNGDVEKMLPHVVNLSLPGINAEAALVALKGLIGVSNGSACTSASYESSHVLLSMGLSNERIAGALRISWNHLTPLPDWNEITKKLSIFRK